MFNKLVIDYKREEFNLSKRTLSPTEKENQNTRGETPVRLHRRIPPQQRIKPKIEDRENSNSYSQTNILI